MILKKAKGKKIIREDQVKPKASFEQLILLIKVLLILFLVFSAFHLIIKKKVQSIAVHTIIPAIQTTTVKKGPHQISVKEGDTLWSIVHRLYPKDNPVKRIKEIQQLNRLSGDQLKPGQVIKLP